MLKELSELAAVVGTFFLSPLLERLPAFRAVPAKFKPLVVSALALVVSAVVLYFRASAEGGVSAENLVGSAWVTMLGLLSCTTGYTMMVVPFSDKESQELIGKPADTSKGGQ